MNNIKCEICGLNCSIKGLSSHLRKHKITVKEYYDKYLKKDGEGICPVCGNEPKLKSVVDGYFEYCSVGCVARSDKTKKKKGYIEKIRNEKYKCKKCQKGFLDYNCFIRHLNKVKECNNYYIENYKYKDLFPETIEHIKEKQKNKKFKFYCEFCKKGFSSRYNIGKHLQPKSNGPCLSLHIEKYGYEHINRPWNKPVKCKNEHCSTLVHPGGKTGLCQLCASKEVVRDPKRNAKLTTIKKEFVNDGVVEWKCEFCENIFLTKSELNAHAKNSKCSKLFFNKYRISGLFPWNFYDKYTECKKCGNIISNKNQQTLYNICIGQWIANNYQLGNESFKKLKDIYDKYYTPKFYDPSFRKKIFNEQCICPICNNLLKNGEVLHLHHINYDKKSDKRENLVFLHHSCHAKTNWNRSYYIKLLKEFNTMLFSTKIE